LVGFPRFFQTGVWNFKNVIIGPEIVSALAL
jgi:hypothetical protein